jgi:hypothetical protein
MARYRLAGTAKKGRMTICRYGGKEVNHFMPQVAEAFTTEELDLEHGELLPARQAMRRLNFAHVTAINVALALNVASPGATAVAVAEQQVAVFQG